MSRNFGTDIEKKKSWWETHIDYHSLSESKEKTIPRIDFHSRILSFISEMIEQLEMIESSLSPMTHSLLSLRKLWAKYFLRRHPHLKAIYALLIDPIRVAQIKLLINKSKEPRKFSKIKNIDPQNIYNIDKSGFNVNIIHVRWIEIWTQKLRSKHPLFK